MAIGIYLNFNGNTSEVMDYYAAATGGKVLSKMTFGESQMPTSDSWKDKIMHGQVEMHGQVVMFSDSREGHDAVMGDNFYISLDYKDEATQAREFAALSEGGKVEMPLQETFWGAVFGMCTDKYGVHWMFNHDKPKA